MSKFNNVPEVDTRLDQIFPVVEIFYSIQGEGHFSGHPSIFIRFGGCNLACSLSLIHI